MNAPGTPLFPTADGRVVDRARAVVSIKVVLEAAGEPLTDEQGGERFEGAMCYELRARPDWLSWAYR